MLRDIELSSKIFVQSRIDIVIMTRFGHVNFSLPNMLFSTVYKAKTNTEAFCTIFLTFSTTCAPASLHPSDKGPLKPSATHEPIFCARLQPC